MLYRIRLRLLVCLLALPMLGACGVEMGTQVSYGYGQEDSYALEEPFFAAEYGFLVTPMFIGGELFYVGPGGQRVHRGEWDRHQLGRQGRESFQHFNTQRQARPQGQPQYRQPMQQRQPVQQYRQPAQQQQYRQPMQQQYRQPAQQQYRQPMQVQQRQPAQQQQYRQPAQQQQQRPAQQQQQRRSCPPNRPNC